MIRSPFAYTPRPGPLQAASPGAAVAYLGSLVAVAFLYSSPIVLVAVGVAAVTAGVLAGARRAVRAALWMGLTLGAPDRRRQRDRRQQRRDGDRPARGLADLRPGRRHRRGDRRRRRSSPCARVVVLVAFAVYSACVDPDRVLRALRPLAGRSALTATLVSRLVPVAAADAARLRDAAQLRGRRPPPRSGKAQLARRLLAGSLDRAVDVAATLELRGYGLGSPRVAKAGATAPVTTARFYAFAAARPRARDRGARSLGAGGFHAYPTDRPRRRHRDPRPRGR